MHVTIVNEIQNIQQILLLWNPNCSEYNWSNGFGELDWLNRLNLLKRLDKLDMFNGVDWFGLVERTGLDRENRLNRNRSDWSDRLDYVWRWTGWTEIACRTVRVQVCLVCTVRPRIEQSQCLERINLTIDFKMQLKQCRDLYNISEVLLMINWWRVFPSHWTC